MCPVRLCRNYLTNVRIHTTVATPNLFEGLIDDPFEESLVEVGAASSEKGTTVHVEATDRQPSYTVPRKILQA